MGDHHRHSIHYHPPIAAPHGRFHNPWGRHNHSLCPKNAADNTMTWLVEEPKNSVWISGIDKERLCRLGLPRAARPVHSFGIPQDCHGGFGHPGGSGMCALLADSSAMDSYRPKSQSGSLGSRTSSKSKRPQAGTMLHAVSAPALIGGSAVGSSTTLPLSQLPLLQAPKTPGSQRGVDTFSDAPSSQLCDACRCKRCGRTRSSRSGTPATVPGRLISTAPAPTHSLESLGATCPAGDLLASDAMERPVRPPSLLPEILELLSVG